MGLGLIQDGNGRGAAPVAAGSRQLAPGINPALLDGWRRLDDYARHPTQTSSFHAALAQTMLAGMVVQWLGIQDEAGLIAVLPLFRQPRLMARWHAAGDRQVYEPVDALCCDDRAAEQLAHKVAALSRPVRMERVPADSIFVPALKRAMRWRGLVMTRPSLASPTIVLDGADPDPVARFNAGRRSDFRRARRRAEALGAVSFEVISPGEDDFAALFDEAVRVECKGWKGEAGSALAEDPPKNAFFRAYLHGSAAAGTCRIAFMRIGGKAVAMQLAVVVDRRFWLLKIGFDEAFARCSPGNLLMLHTMEYAARSGLSSYELLGEEEGWIREVWTSECHPCLRLQTYPFTPAGLGSLVAEAGHWAWHRRPHWRGAGGAAPGATDMGRA